jgi:hypothetical protein
LCADYLQRLKENRQELTKLLNAKIVAASMFTVDALKLEELLTIVNSDSFTNPFKAAEDLLQIVLEAGKEACFMTELWKTEQRHIWHWLSYRGTNICYTLK